MAKVVCLGIQIVDILGRPVTEIPQGQNVALLEEIRITVAGTAAGTSIDVDYFMPGYEEAIMMCGLTERQEVIRFFLDRGAKYTVFKMGEEGSSIACLENGRIKEIRIPCFKAPVVDSTGCGDSYCAGFIMGLSMGWDLEKAGRLGTAAGGLVIQGLGSDAGIVNLDQTIDFMNTAEELPINVSD